MHFRLSCFLNNTRVAGENVVEFCSCKTEKNVQKFEFGNTELCFVQFQVLGNSQKEYEKMVVEYSVKNQLRFKGNLSMTRLILSFGVI